ncbi:hypothetical protein MANES_02G078351v8 [Manihot esculenta]|uniref:Uncharacterized protein n=1 Tax=Manihot esculenta TaxID=3983 RepID=A0ACB7I7E9_MANES|nr:hypothetical protein MANES_02G078351v8 [Manihot esculenta]
MCREGSKGSKEREKEKEKGEEELSWPNRKTGRCNQNHFDNFLENLNTSKTGAVILLPLENLALSALRLPKLSQPFSLTKIWDRDLHDFIPFIYKINFYFYF